MKVSERAVLIVGADGVFDGQHPHRLPTDPVSPVTEYGRQKAEVERHLLTMDAPAAVVRLTKVLQPGFPLLRGWVDALKIGEPILPFSDMVMAPVTLAF